MHRRTATAWIAGLGLSGLTAPAQASWNPSERINYIIGVAPGGTVDLYARGIKDTLDSLKLTHGQSVLVENKVGAGGAIAMQFLKGQAGNAHYLGTFHTGAIAGAVSGLIKADPRDFLPVAMLVEETSLVAVRADSPLKDGLDLVAALKAEPAKLRIAVAPALGQNTHLALAKPLSVAGVAIGQLTIAPFRSSGESVTALIGGHVDVVSATAPVILPQVQAGKLRILASAAPEPGNGALAGVKTWRQLGVAADYVSYNGVTLPPGVNADQIRFWEEALRQVAHDKAWIAMVEKSGNKPIFRGYVDSHRYLQSEWTATTELVRQLNLGAGK
ncbi:tripartite tricarboxylate transporter substrate binding protein [Ideonella sp. 4Y11]|uniref:Tripartite tricarboxylate transporter substrate binding protein n=1 Tax=Ideonella aquatica TaxID=2824119 RepID=A0A940YLM5_9BURK|nr:tripartite tricarboxylate transporter substrate binding protein [Ideonella aquatica]MBQ0960231.1 tripartite tricarboxylate transporter substrate binding protein [Ideonella aquatica]